MTNGSLFRQEATKAPENSLYGNVSLAVPLAWHLLGLFIFILVMTLIAFVATAEYTRSETVEGAIAPDRGVIAIVSTRSGVVTRLLAQEGRFVKSGDILANISGEETAGTGERVQTLAVDAIGEQIRSINDQSKALGKANVDFANQSEAKLAGLSSDINGIIEQITLQQELVTSAQSDLDSIREVLKRGFVSRREARSREEIVVQRRQHLQELRQNLAAKKIELVETRRQIDADKSRGVAAIAAISASAAQLRGARATAESAKAYQLRSTVDGRVTGVTVHVGDVIQPTKPMMMIVPQGAAMRAELRLPSRAAGFVKSGQDVHLMVDSYPYDRFGTIQATLVSVSQAPVPQETITKGGEPYFLAIASIKNPNVYAFGTKHPLVPGMVVKARITTDRQSLLKWLFQPLFAARR